MYFNAENKSIGEDLFLRTKVKCVFSSLFTQNIADYRSTKHTYDNSARKKQQKTKPYGEGCKQRHYTTRKKE
jgi:hypothetical protein